MHLDDLCIKWCFIIEVCFFYLMLFIGFNSRKIFKAYYGFRVLYVFPFPSDGHGPIGSGRDTHPLKPSPVLGEPLISGVAAPSPAACLLGTVDSH